MSVSISMWVAIALNQCAICAGWPALGLLSGLAAHQTGIIMVATALLFPTTALLYGGITMFFAAKETVERWAAAKDAKAEARGREQGVQVGREAERQRIAELLEQNGVPLPPEVAEGLNANAR